jgi:hypothetical protein
MAGTHALGGVVTAQQATFAVTAAQAETAGATLGTIYVPNKATILEIILTTEDLDDGATLELDVGDSSGPETADDNRFIDQFSGQAAGTIRAVGLAAADGLLVAPYTYRNLAGTDDAQTEQAIEITVAAAAATGAAGNITMTVIYFVNG